MALRTPSGACQKEEKEEEEEQEQEEEGEEKKNKKQKKNKKKKKKTYVKPRTSTSFSERGFCRSWRLELTACQCHQIFTASTTLLFLNVKQT